MPNRIIREGLLDSPRYWSVTVEARQLFVHLMLLADDFGLVSLAPVLIRRRCFDDAPTQVKVDKLLEQLHDADLIRVYENSGRRFGFIPRFGQVLRIDKAKCPLPPAELFANDIKAVEKFHRNKDVFQKMHGGGTASVPHPQRTRHAEVEVKGSGNEEEVEGKKTQQQRQKLAEQEKPRDLTAWAEERGIKPYPAESNEAFNRRATAAYAAERTSTSVVKT